MTQENKNKYQEIIDLLGIETVEKMYRLLGPEKISAATLMKIIVEHKIILSLKKYSSVKKVAKENYVSRMTIYRILKGKKIKSQK